jgi:hypothetical protein
MSLNSTAAIEICGKTMRNFLEVAQWTYPWMAPEKARRMHGGTGELAR